MRTTSRTIAVLVCTGLAGGLVLRRVRRRRATGPVRSDVEAVHPPMAAVRLANPVVRWMLSSPGRAGRAGDELMLLHVTGRRTGRAYDIPVGYHRGPDGRLVVVTDALWRLNLRGRPDVEVTLEGVRRAARAELVEDPHATAEVYGALIDARDPRASARRLGLRLPKDEVPGHEALAALAERERLCVIRLEVPGTFPPDA